MAPRKIRLGYAPAPDGAVLFSALATGRTDTEPFEIRPTPADLSTLHERASRGELEATMIRPAAWPYVQQRYVLAACGGCFAGEGGPALVAAEGVEEAELAGGSVAVPDATSSGSVAVQLLRPGLRTRLLPTDKIVPALKMGLVTCAVLSHCDERACREQGLRRVADLGACWSAKTDGLPLPLTCLAIRGDLEADERVRLVEVLRGSIELGLADRAEAVRFAVRAVCEGGGAVADEDLALGTGVGPLTMEMGRTGQRALEEFLARACAAQVLPAVPPLRFVEDNG